jgi:hypothetical protein
MESFNDLNARITRRVSEFRISSDTKLHSAYPVRSTKLRYGMIEINPNGDMSAPASKLFQRETKDRTVFL